MNLSNVVAALLVLGGLGYGVVANQDGVDTNELAKIALAVVGGVVVLGWNNVDKVKGLFKERKVSEQVFSPKDFEKRDLDCLVHLRNRCKTANSKEGLDVCAKLNDIIFNLDTRKEEQTNVQSK